MDNGEICWFDSYQKYIRGQVSLNAKSELFKNIFIRNEFDIYIVLNIHLLYNVNIFTLGIKPLKKK